MAHTTQTDPNTVDIVSTQSIEINTPLKLLCGETLSSHNLVYETYGELNSSKSNAILICHALSSNHHAAGFYADNSNNPDPKTEGWWNDLIGPGKTIDTNRFYIVCSNNIGGCHGSTGPKTHNPKTGKLFGPDFPIVTVEDWVSSQALLSLSLIHI